MFDQKKTHQRWKIYYSNLENQTFQRTAKFIMVNSYKMDFMKVLLISTVTKSRWDVQYLEVC